MKKILNPFPSSDDVEIARGFPVDIMKWRYGQLIYVKDDAIVYVNNIHIYWNRILAVFK